MNPATIEYKRKVWQFLETMKPEVSYTVEKLSKPETRNNFIAAVKEYMEAMPWQGWISFNADYSKLYKIHPITFKN